MTHEDFDYQMGRLMNCFGDKHYPKERQIMIWKEINSQTAAWMMRTVDEMVGCCRFPPLLPEFREAMVKERERVFSRRRNQDDPEEAWSNLAPEEIRARFRKIIQEAMAPEVTPQDPEPDSKRDREWYP